MRLGWHIVRKDLRRMALPVALWLAFIQVVAIWFSWVSPDVEGHAGSEISTWLSLMSFLIRLVVAAQLLIGYVMAGALVLEDAPTGENGFAMTRPVGRMRLLIAKVIAAALLFVVGPMAVLVPVWLGSGFVFDEMMRAMREVLQWQGAVTLVALGVASLTRNLVQFLLCTVGMYVAFTLYMFAGGLPVLSPSPSPSLWRSRTFLVYAAVFPVMAVILAHQYLTRKTARSWLIIVLALLGCGAIRVAWPWDFRAGMAKRNERSQFFDHPADRTANIVVAPSFIQRSRTGWLPHINVVAPWSREQFYAPLGMRRVDGSVATTMFGNWGEAVCLRAIGFDSGDGPLTWQFTLQPETAGQAGLDIPHLAGELEVWVARAQVIGEMPLQVGAASPKGRGQTRIAALTRGEGDRLDEIFIEERESGSASDLRVHQTRDKLPNRSHIDRFLLIHRLRREVRLLSVSEVDAVDLRAQRIVFRRLFVPGIDDWRDAVLVKVRFERIRSFQRPIDVRGVTIPEEEKRP